MPWSRLTAQTVTSEAARKAATVWPSWSLRTINRPPRITTGSMLGVPTHQLAEKLRTNDVMMAATAAGLKRCLLRNARMYFEPTASTPAQARYCRSPKDCAGWKISARISAVIAVDSIFDGALKAQAKIAFAA